MTGNPLVIPGKVKSYILTWCCGKFDICLKRSIDETMTTMHKSIVKLRKICMSVIGI